MKYVKKAEDAFGGLAGNERVFVHGCSATPLELLQALGHVVSEQKPVELIHLHTEGSLEFLVQNPSGFKVANLFVGANYRKLLDYDRIDYLPCFLSEIPQLFRSGVRPIDVALIQVSPPDNHGYCSLGTSVDIAKAAVEVAHTVIAEINPQMPRVHGDGFVHVDDIDIALAVDRPLPEISTPIITDVEEKIGKNVSELIDDGATIQLGIGAIPDAVARALRHHKHLGLHTEMWSDGALALIECGAIDNSLKKVRPGKSVSSFVYGSKRLYDFIHDNPSVFQLDAGYVNHLAVISRNPKVAAVNSAVEVDLTGQVCADSIGSRIISGVGGQMDFVRAASFSPGGKPIIALTSRTKNGKSRIVSTLRDGAGVVTTRGHVHFIVTEYGAVDLYGKTLKERKDLLISIAHPEDRENLESDWKEKHRKL